MLKILYKVTVAVLAVLLGLHIIASLAWGSWNPDGAGSLGFWVIFSETVIHYAWLYAVLIFMAVIFRFLHTRRTKGLQ